MTAAELPYASDEVLRLLEGFGLVGGWSWDFTTDTHVWSPGFYRILGLEPAELPARYGLFLSLVHPEDQPRMESATQLAQEGVMREHTFRVLRPDGAERVLSSRGRVYHAPDGRPRGAAGTILDVTDREALAQVQAAERRRRRLVFEQARSFTSTTRCYPYTDFSAEFVELTGLPKAELLEEPTRPVVAAERRHWREIGRAGYLGRQIVHTTPLLTVADGARIRFRMVMVPMRDALGQFAGWANYVGPSHEQALRPSGDLLCALEAQVEARHLRAARALLGWSMSDLARASGISFSTIRRLEEGAAGSILRNRQAAIAALRASGIRFSLVAGSAIAVAKV